MNTGLWIAQILVAVVSILTGGAKLVLSREQLAPKMHWAGAWPRRRIKLLGLAEVAGALGLIAPTATGIAPWLTSVAALCLALLMVGAIHTHRQLREPFTPALVMGALCLVIAAGRLLELHPLTLAHAAS